MEAKRKNERKEGWRGRRDGEGGGRERKGEGGEVEREREEGQKGRGRKIKKRKIETSRKNIEEGTSIHSGTCIC